MTGPTDREPETGPSPAMDPGKSLTRKEFDEIIRRATELAAHESDSGEAELDEQELLRIAGEVGIQERYVRRALAEVRDRYPQGNLLDRIFGPDVVRASRVVPGSLAEVAGKLDDFLVAGQLLQPVRRGPRVLHYRPAVDWASQIARAASATSRRYYVASAKSVEIELSEVEEGRTLVAMVVDPGTRNDSLVGGFLGGTAGGAAVAVGTGLAVMALAPLVVAVAVGGAVGVGATGGIVWFAGRHHQNKLQEVRAEVEGVLDRLESGESLEPPPASWRRWVKRHFHGVARDLMGEVEDED